MKQMPSTTFNYLGTNYTILGYSDKDHIFKQIVLKNCFYEIRTLEVIKNLNLRGTYIDIGSNIGNHSIFFLNECKSSYLYSIEANAKLIPILQKNLFENNFGKKAYLIFDCVISTKEVVYFHNKIDSNNICMSYFSEIYSGDKDVEVKKGISLDYLLTTIKPTSKVKLIKIDVEGQELDVLASSSEILNQYKPFICVEIFPENYPKVSKFLRKNNYICYKIISQNYIFANKYSFQFYFLILLDKIKTLKKILFKSINLFRTFLENIKRLIRNI